MKAPGYFGTIFTSEIWSVTVRPAQPLFIGWLKAT
jgi:hypothetical protein